MAKSHTHEWQENNRFLPLTDDDLDMRRVFPEHPRDENGKMQPLDEKGYEHPDPFISYQCTSCPETKQEKVPKRDFERLKKMLENGEMSPEHLSQLPLGELIPGMKDKQGVLSGASRAPASSDEEGGDDE